MGSRMHPQSVLRFLPGTLGSSHRTANVSVRTHASCRNESVWKPVMDARMKKMLDEGTAAENSFLSEELPAVKSGSSPQPHQEVMIGKAALKSGSLPKPQQE